MRNSGKLLVYHTVYGETMKNDSIVNIELVVLSLNHGAKDNIVFFF